jgi:two-component system, sporulation sensor kinase A
MRTPAAEGEEVHVLLTAFYENTDDAILITQFESLESMECRFWDANPAACQLLGYEKDELLGSSPDEILFSTIGSRVKDFIKEMFFEKKQALHEIELRTKEGQTVLAEIKSSIFLFNGQRFALNTIKNIEKKKEMQDKWLAEKNLTIDLLDGVQAYIMIMDRLGRIVSWNKFCEEKTGYLSDEVKGKAVWDLLVNDEEKRSFKKICGNGLSPSDFHESCWVTKEGAPLHIQWSISYLQGEGHYIIGSGTDISERKAYEKSLLASTQKYRSLVEDNPDGIVLFAAGSQVYLNKEAKSILGYPSELADRSSLLSRIQPEDRGKALAYFRRLTSRPSHSHRLLDLEIIRPDSSKITVEAKGIIKKIAGENFIQVVLRDISVQKDAEQNLRQVNRQMDNVLSSTDEVIIGLDKNFQITFVNETLLVLLNAREDEIVGSHGQNLFDHMAEMTAGEAISLEGLLKGDHKAEIPFISNGAMKYFEVKVVPMGSEEGALITMYDITDRILLNRQRERYYEAVACGITVQDSSGKIIFANQKAVDICGLSREELARLRSSTQNWILYDENGKNLPLEEHPWKKAVVTKKEIRNFVMGFHHPVKKEQKWILVNTRNVLMDKETSVENIISTFHDITAKVEVDRMIKEKEKLALVGQLAAGVAHEVKNPLTSSLGFLKMMQNEQSVNQDYLEIILDELESINQVTSEFLTLAEPQSIKMDYIYIFEDILVPLVKSLKPQLLKSRTRINLDEESAGLPLRGVKEQLDQLFTNIFMNSIEAMPEGGIINVSVIQEAKNMVVRIKDEGVGIAPDRLRHLGEPFYSIKEKGTGLGLLLCKKITHEHRGSMVIKSVQGKGTIVEISLPVTDRREALPE